MIKQRGYKRLRRARILVSVGVMAVMTGALALGYTTFLWRWQLTAAVLAGTGVWVMLWAVVTALFGRVYCSTACPLGTLQDIIARLRKRPFGYFYADPVKGVRRLFVGVMVVSVLLGLWRIAEAFNPGEGYARIVRAAMIPWVRGAAYGLGTLAGAVATLAVCAVLALWRGRLLCNTLCPLGTVLGAFSRQSLFKIDINTDMCVGCGNCTASCKAQCIDPRAHTVDFSRCVVCFDCMAKCPNDAIKMTRRRHQLQWPMTQEVALKMQNPKVKT